MNAKERIKEFMGHLEIGQGAFEKAAGLSNGYINSNKGSIGSDILNRIVLKYPELNISWVITGEGAMLKEAEAGSIHLPGHIEPVKNYNLKGAPYYDVDFVGGFDLVLNDQTINPDYYIDLPPFNKSDIIWCNLYGKSMEPYIFSGDKIAVKEVMVPDVVFGKVYGVVTLAGLRTVKWVVRSPEKDCYRLVPENKDPKFGDYQDVGIGEIFKIFLVLGAVRAF